MDEIEQLRQKIQEAREREMSKRRFLEEPMKYDLDSLKKLLGYKLEDIGSAVSSAFKNPNYSKLYNKDTGELMGVTFKNPLTGRETPMLNEELAEEAMPDTEADELYWKKRRAEYQQKNQPENPGLRMPASIDKFPNLTNKLGK